MKCLRWIHTHDQRLQLVLWCNSRLLLLLMLFQSFALHHDWQVLTTECSDKNVIIYLFCYIYKFRNLLFIIHLIIGTPHCKDRTQAASKVLGPLLVEYQSQGLFTQRVMETWDPSPYSTHPSFNLAAPWCPEAGNRWRGGLCFPVIKMWLLVVCVFPALPPAWVFGTNDENTWKTRGDKTWKLRRLEERPSKYGP